MSHAWQRQSTVIQKENKRNQNKLFFRKVLSKKICESIWCRMCLLFWDHSILHQITSSLLQKYFPPFFSQACLWNASSSYHFAYEFGLPISSSLLGFSHPSQRCEGRFDLNRCWWTNAFLSLSAVQLSVRDSLCLPLKLLTFSLKMAILESWHAHLTLTERIVRCQQRFVTISAPRSQRQGECLTSWVSGTEEDRAWRGAESTGLGMKLQKRKEIQQFIEKQRRQPKTRWREIRKKN